MQTRIVYACTGDCSGVAPIAKNCGAASCNHFNQPLEAREQCERCGLTTQSTGKLSACAACKKI